VITISFPPLFTTLPYRLPLFLLHYLVASTPGWHSEINHSLNATHLLRQLLHLIQSIHLTISTTHNPLTFQFIIFTILQQNRRLVSSCWSRYQCVSSAFSKILSSSKVKIHYSLALCPICFTQLGGKWKCCASIILGLETVVLRFPSKIVQIISFYCLKRTLINHQHHHRHSLFSLLLSLLPYSCCSSSLACTILHVNFTGISCNLAQKLSLMLSANLFILLSQINQPINRNTKEKKESLTINVLTGLGLII